MLTSAKLRLSLQTRMIVLFNIVIILIIGSMGAVFSSIIGASIEEQLGKKALSVAKIVANDPELRHAFQTENPSELIQPIAENVRRQTDAEFVVVGNRDGIRYAHPLPDRIGKGMVGGDNELGLLHGQSYISQAVGSLGPSLRGKVPIRDDDGNVVGIVSVGFLLEDIEQAIGDYRKIVLLVACGVAGYFLSKNDFPLAPLVLGPMIENNMRRALTTSNGDFAIFFTKPISAAFLVCALLWLIIPLLLKRRGKQVVVSEEA